MIHWVDTHCHLGTLAEAAILACDWFTRYLLPAEPARAAGATA